MKVPLELEQILIQGKNYHAQGNTSLATERFNKYINSLKKHLSLIFVLASDNEKEGYWNYYIDDVAYIQKYALSYADKYPPLGALAYDCELLTKGLLLESSNRLKLAILNSGNKSYIKWLNAIEDIRQLYTQIRGYCDLLEADSTYIAAQSIVRQGGSHILSQEIEKAEKYYKRMDEIADKIAEFEQEMSIRTSLHKIPLQSLSVSWRDIQNALSPRQAAIEFVARQITSDSPSVAYYAIVIRKGIDNPIVVPLFLEDVLVDIMQTSNPDFSLLFDKIWRPIGWHLEDIRDIYLATSGLMNGVPFAALQYKGNFLTDYYYIRNLLTTRDIISLKQEAWENKKVSENALFFGGADFGISPKTNIGSSRGQGFDYLPQSKKEVESSNELLSKMGWKTSLFTDISASRQNLLNAVSLQSPSILHIATHGFYFTKRNRTVSDLKMSDIGSVAKSQYTVSQNPLMRCGLLFSGANHLWSGKELADSIDNGILTGEDMSRLNLFKTELAVISACHTAMGDIDYAEGVHGIQRAIKLAGAKKMIVALWEIPDKESAEFMEEFYTFLRVSRNVAASFRHAQQFMQQKYYAYPKKWAGFVLIE